MPKVREIYNIKLAGIKPSSTLEENTNPLLNGIINIIHLYIRIRVIVFSATFIKERSRQLNSQL